MESNSGVSCSFSDMLDSIRRDPTVIATWGDQQCLSLMNWLCSPGSKNPVYQNHDYSLLHCLLRSGPLLINSLLKVPSGHGHETALSIAILHENRDLATYLLKMGASPDILIGWDSVLLRSCSFAFDRLNDGLEARWRDLVLEICEPPCRLTAMTDAPSYPMKDSAFLEWVKDQDIDRFDDGIEYDISQIKRDRAVVKRWSRLHLAFVFAKLVKRRPCGPIENDFSIIDAILESGQVGADDYLVDDNGDRVTALHEAVSRKNIPFVRYLLTVRKADPSKRSFVDAMPWNDQTHVVSPLGVSLRGFLVWNDAESASVEAIAELLLEAGISEASQIHTIDTIWHDHELGMLDLQESLHLIRVVRLIVRRNPGIVRSLQRPLSDLLPRLFGNCEVKWIKEVFDGFHNGKSDVFSRILLEGIPLLIHALSLHSFAIPPAALFPLITKRCYRTMAALVKGLGRGVPLDQIPLHTIAMSDVLTDEMAEIGITREMALKIDSERAKALLEVCTLATGAAQTWMPFLGGFLAGAGNDGDLGLFLPLRIRAKAAVNDGLRDGVLSREYVRRAVPPPVWAELTLERQFLVLDQLRES